MKTTTHYFFALIFFILFISAKAQDTLYLKNGSKVPSQITEITPSVVRYKKPSNPDGPTYIMNAIDIHYIKYRNGTADTLTASAPIVATTPANSVKSPVLAEMAPTPAKRLDEHPPIYKAGLFYKYDNKRIKRREAYHVMQRVTDPEIDMHIKKAKLDKGLEYVGFVAIPAFVGGAAATGVAFLNNLDLEPGDARTSYAPGAILLGVGVVSLGTSITFKIIGKKNMNAAIKIYNEKY